jgi:hypothetical protein
MNLDGAVDSRGGTSSVDNAESATMVLDKSASPGRAVVKKADQIPAKDTYCRQRSVLVKPIWLHGIQTRMSNKSSTYS